MKEYKRRCDLCGHPAKLKKELLSPRYYKDIYVRICEDCQYKLIQKVMNDIK